jgi:hypothetical protein
VAWRKGVRASSQYAIPKWCQHYFQVQMCHRCRCIQIAQGLPQTLCSFCGPFSFLCRILLLCPAFLHDFPLHGTHGIVQEGSGCTTVILFLFFPATGWKTAQIQFGGRCRFRRHHRHHAIVNSTACQNALIGVADPLIRASSKWD